MPRARLFSNTTIPAKARGIGLPIAEKKSTSMTHTFTLQDNHFFKAVTYSARGKDPRDIQMIEASTVPGSVVGLDPASTKNGCYARYIFNADRSENYPRIIRDFFETVGVRSIGLLYN